MNKYLKFLSIAMIATVSASSFANIYIGSSSGALHKTHTIDGKTFATERSYVGANFGIENFLTPEAEKIQKGLSYKIDLGIYSLRTPEVIFADARFDGADISMKRNTIGWALAYPIFSKEQDKWDNEVILNSSASLSASGLIGFRHVIQAGKGPYISFGAYGGIRAANNAMPVAAIGNLDFGVGYNLGMNSVLGVKFSGTVGVESEAYFAEGMAALEMKF